MSFFAKVGVVAGAVIACATIAGLLISFAWATATHPILDAISAERQARQAADEEIAAHLQGVSRDRIDMLVILMSAPGTPERREAIESMEQRWRREETVSPFTKK